MTWRERVLKKHKKEIVLSAAFVLVLALATAFWHYFTGKSFEWQSITPIEQPELLPRLFYSALVFFTLGGLLYAAGFYKFLYSLFRGTRGGYRAYKDTKGLIWWLLVLLMFFVIVPFVVGLLNAIISFFFNLYILTLYLLPPLAISMLVCGLGFFIYKRVS